MPWVAVVFNGILQTHLFGIAFPALPSSANLTTGLALYPYGWLVYPFTIPSNISESL